MPFDPRYQRFQKHQQAQRQRPPEPPRNLDGSIMGSEPIAPPRAPEGPPLPAQPLRCGRHPEIGAVAAVYVAWEWELLCSECAEQHRGRRYRP